MSVEKSKLTVEEKTASFFLFHCHCLEKALFHHHSPNCAQAD